MKYMWDHQLPDKFIVFENARSVRTVAECHNELDAELVTNALNAYK